MEPTFRDVVRINDQAAQRRWRRGGGAPPIPQDPIPVGSNVRLTLRDKPGGDVVDERVSHNIFLNYGREWISELVGLDAGYVPFRTDRIRYMAFGIGGTDQLIPSATLRALWTGFPNAWGFTNPADPTTGGYGVDSGPAVGDPAQTDTDPLVTGLEYPVQYESASYADDVAAPASFPEAGTVRFTTVLGYNQVSFGAATSVPISEIGLFTETADPLDPPLPATRQVTPPIPPLPGLGVRYMVAYNTFPPLSKTSAFVLQVDWELRFA